MILSMHRKVRKMQYDKSFKDEAVKLSDEIGVKAAASQLGITIHYPVGVIIVKNTATTIPAEAAIKECLLILLSSASVSLRKKMRN